MSQTSLRVPGARTTDFPTVRSFQRTRWLFKSRPPQLLLAVPPALVLVPAPLFHDQPALLVLALPQAQHQVQRLPAPSSLSMLLPPSKPALTCA